MAVRSVFRVLGSGDTQSTSPPNTLALWDPTKTTEMEAESGGAALAVSVEDVEAAAEELRAAGVTVLAGTMDTPACYMAVIADPDGNRVILHQRKDGTWV